MNDYWTERQKQDIAYYNDNINKWVNNPLYKMKFIIISGQEIKGFYDTFEAALGAAVMTFNNGDYIIQQIISKNEEINFLSPALAMV
jgi:hypothetical protein